MNYHYTIKWANVYIILSLNIKIYRSYKNKNRKTITLCILIYYKIYRLLPIFHFKSRI